MPEVDDSNGIDLEKHGVWIVGLAALAVGAVFALGKAFRKTSRSYRALGGEPGIRPLNGFVPIVHQTDPLNQAYGPGSKVDFKLQLGKHQPGATLPERVKIIPARATDWASLPAFIDVNTTDPVTYTGWLSSAATMNADLFVHAESTSVPSVRETAKVKTFQVD